MCQPVRQDDPTIADKDRLFRRIHPDHHLVRDDDTGLARISSGAFRDKELSVDIESVMRGIGKIHVDCLQNYVGYMLVSITAGKARQCRQIVCRDPLPNNPSHGLVFGSKNNKRDLEELRKSAQWVIPTHPPPYD